MSIISVLEQQLRTQKSLEFLSFSCTEPHLNYTILFQSSSLANSLQNSDIGPNQFQLDVSLHSCAENDICLFVYMCMAVKSKDFASCSN